LQIRLRIDAASEYHARGALLAARKPRYPINAFEATSLLSIGVPSE
jgi:hypothetical protein